jgi:hypothetical protein
MNYDFLDIVLIEYIPVLVAIHDTWHHRMCIGTCADDEEEDEQQRLEIEEGSLSYK